MKIMKNKLLKNTTTIVLSFAMILCVIPIGGHIVTANESGIDVGDGPIGDGSVGSDDGPLDHIGGNDVGGPGDGPIGDGSVGGDNGPLDPTGGNEMDGPGDGPIGGGDVGGGDGPLDPTGDNGVGGDKVYTMTTFWIRDHINEIIYGETVTFIAVTSLVSASEPPRYGTIVFEATFVGSGDGALGLSRRLGEDQVNEFGQVVFFNTDLGVGTWGIQASYQGNDYYNESLSGVVYLTVLSRCSINGCDIVTIVTPSTCTEGGVIADVCSREECGEYKVVGYSQPLGHQMEQTVTPPTCTEEGFTTYHCVREGCDHSETGDPVSALGHDWNTTIHAQTCTEEGFTIHICSRCDDISMEGIVEADGHKYALYNIAPTCTTNGEWGIRCETCDVVLESRVSEALGHLRQVAVTPVTCLTDGFVTHTCIRAGCGDVFIDNRVAAQGHNYVSIVTAPTTATGGFTTHFCSRCGSTYVDSLTARLPQQNNNTGGGGGTTIINNTGGTSGTGGFGTGGTGGFNTGGTGGSGGTSGTGGTQTPVQLQQTDPTAPPINIMIENVLPPELLTLLASVPEATVIVNDLETPLAGLPIIAEQSAVPQPMLQWIVIASTVIAAAAAVIAIAAVLLVIFMNRFKKETRMVT